MYLNVEKTDEATNEQSALKIYTFQAIMWQYQKDLFKAKGP